MSLNQIIDHQPLLPLVCDDTLMLKGNQLRLKNSLNVPNGTFDNVDTITINGNVYPPGAGFLPSAVPNKVLRTNGFNVVSWGDVSPSNLTGGLPGDVLKTISPGVVAWDPVKAYEITPGLANQILQTNSLGTAAAWQNLVVPATSITAGADYTVLTSAGGSALWITPSVVNQIKYGTTFLAQNINAAAGPTALQFSTSTFINSAISNVGVPVNITQPSATEFTIGTSSVYNIDITGYIDPASAGLGNSVVTLSLEVAGTEKTDYCIVCSGNYSFSGRFPAVFITAGQNIRVLARRVVGTSALTTFANGLPAPSFASSILIST